MAESAAESVTDSLHTTLGLMPYEDCKDVLFIVGNVIKRHYKLGGQKALYGVKHHYDSSEYLYDGHTVYECIIQCAWGSSNWEDTCAYFDNQYKGKFTRLPSGAEHVGEILVRATKANLQEVQAGLAKNNGCICGIYKNVNGIS